MTKLLTVLVTGLTLALFAPPAPGKVKPPPSKEELERKAANTPVVGTVLKVEGNKITIQTRGKNAGEVTVETDSKTQFELHDEAIKLEQVRPGMDLAALPPKGIARKIVVDDFKKKRKKDATSTAK